MGRSCGTSYCLINSTHTSAYGSSAILNPSIAPMSEAANSQQSNKSVASTLTAKKAEAAAQLAAKEAELKAIENEEAKKVQL